MDPSAPAAWRRFAITELQVPPQLVFAKDVSTLPAGVKNFRARWPDQMHVCHLDQPNRYMRLHRQMRNSTDRAESDWVLLNIFSIGGSWWRAAYLAGRISLCVGLPARKALRVDPMLVLRCE